MLSLEDAATVLAPLAVAKGLVLAVSGGADSVALMLLAAHWPGRPPVIVATVDHGLRPDSRREAETVGLWAAALGLRHCLLTWQGDKPATRIQEKARAARYALLVQCAKDHGADAIATGHHADDQAETILFRLVKGSGMAGLAGMQAVMRRDDVTHFRPLLDIAKTGLIDVCARQNHPWFEDPSNRNEFFARPHLRRIGGLLAHEGFGRDALVRLGKRAARAEAALETMARHANTGGLTSKALADMPEEIALRVIAEAILGITGKTVPLRLERLERMVMGLRQAIAARSCFAASLGGVLVRLDAAGLLHLRPEPQRRRGKPPPPPAI